MKGLEVEDLRILQMSQQKQSSSASRSRSRGRSKTPKGKTVTVTTTTTSKKPRNRSTSTPRANRVNSGQNRGQYGLRRDTYGRDLGALLGEGAQSLFSHVFGLGEYKIKANSLLGAIDVGTSPPCVRNVHKGEGMTLRHREYLGELISGTIVSPATTTPFTLQSFNINPGNSSLFPFLAKLAEQFQEYSINGMIVEIKSEASEYAANVSLGTTFMSASYQSLDPAPSSKIELENMEYAVSAKSSKTIIMPIECARANDVLTHLYVAIDSDYQGGDKRFSDLGTLYIGSQGINASSVPLGEIWVSYDITLFKPHIHPPPACPTQIEALYQFSPTNPLGSLSLFQSGWFNAQDPHGLVYSFENNVITLNSVAAGKSFLGMINFASADETLTGTPIFTSLTGTSGISFPKMFVRGGGGSVYPFEYTGVSYSTLNDPEFSGYTVAFSFAVSETPATPISVTIDVGGIPVSGGSVATVFLLETNLEVPPVPVLRQITSASSRQMSLRTTRNK